MIIKGSHLALILLVMIFFASVVQIEASPTEAIKETRHNLIVPTADDTKVCTVCHTDKIPWQSSAHTKTDPSKNQAVVVAPPPLWDAGRSAISPYRAIQTVPLSEHPYNHPTGASLVCLSCHDGALGTDMHGINVADPRIGAAANVPFDGMAVSRGAPPLSRVDHPISIRYPRKPNGIFVPPNPTVTRSRYWALPDRHADGLTLPTRATSSYLDLPKKHPSTAEQLSTLVRTTGGMMECDSCHNPHSEKIRPFLRAPAATLCLVCHDR